MIFFWQGGKYSSLCVNSHAGTFNQHWTFGVLALPSRTTNETRLKYYLKHPRWKVSKTFGSRYFSSTLFRDKLASAKDLFS